MSGGTGRKPTRPKPSRQTPADRRLSGNGGGKPGPKPKPKPKPKGE